MHSAAIAQGAIALAIGVFIGNYLALAGTGMSQPTSGQQQCTPCQVCPQISALVPAPSKSTTDASLIAVLERQEGRFQEAKAEMGRLGLRLRARDFPDVQRFNALIESSDEPFCVNRRHHLDLPWPWFIYKPIWNCNQAERIGEIFDGGKTHCNLGYLQQLPQCVAYSFGSNGIVNYELQLRARTGCDVHIFDPTVSDDRIPTLPPGITFHKVGVSGTTGEVKIGDSMFQVKSLADILAELGHTHINVLKVDIDAYEYALLRSMKESGALASLVDELLLEIHWQGHDPTLDLLETIANAGFRSFNMEPNLFYYALPAAGIEYSYIHDRVAAAYNTFA